MTCTSSTCPRCAWPLSSDYLVITSGPTGTSSWWDRCVSGSTYASRSSIVSIDWLKDANRRFNWFRDFERVLASAVRVPVLLASMRVWRQLRGADATQVRRHKRRRFVQQLAGSLA